MAGLQVPSWRLPKPAPTPTAAPKPPATPTSPNPAGFTTTQNNGASPGVNPTGSTGSGYVPGNYAATPGQQLPPGVSPTGVTWGYDPTGKATPYTPYANPGGETFWRPGDSIDMWGQSMDRMRQLITMMREGGGGPVSMNREPGLTMVGRETPSTMNDRTAAESAAFGRAKERIGKVGKSAIDSLKDKMSSMGMGGSTAEARGVADVTNSAQGEMGEVIRQQAEDHLDRADQIDDRNLTAGLTQRGQDIGQNTTNFTGGIQQRGQDYQGAMNDPTRQMIMQMLSSFYGGGGGGMMGMPRMF